MRGNPNDLKTLGRCKISQASAVYIIPNFYKNDL